MLRIRAARGEEVGRERRWERRQILQDTHLRNSSVASTRRSEKCVCVCARGVGSGWVAEGTRGEGERGKGTEDKMRVRARVQ